MYAEIGRIRLEKIRIMLLVMYLCQVHPTFSPVCDSRASSLSYSLKSSIAFVVYFT